MSSPRTAGSGDRTRLDIALAVRGLARSRSEAAGLIVAGEVIVNGVIATKASLKCAPDDVVALRSSGPRYVSRAGHKLAGALELFADVVTAGRRCLDAGASTGGFTDVLLRAGAQQVVAVDVGHDQLVETLRADQRVDVHEGCNVRDLTPEHLGGAVDLVVSDLSFISLRLVMSPLAGVCRPGADLVLMVKPQFEVGRRALPKTGVVLDPDQRRRAVTVVLDAALDAGLSPRGIARSPLPGQDGNVEFFLWLDRPETEADAMATDTGAEWLGDQTVDWA
ncbi:TlyA family RNA methyltransferase [Citricoccus nitrophenolicus]|uniref:23S rRNA (Cytidine1920-2'-O)/16S rRNA (Cytidine1409-2'-O)-methyltransferase n=1 Tax=Citricoccus muralis TaxID=169134 RepID=A0A3D9LAM3_9MICC|nr:TlyA family RNA methyltransferase [Citricoccus muralis]REE03421.1 23S rRNA (cytidine1920-2'-O)/16S rRNA (cytidine1409-2'-O)-methyltransferase [Citricoccus muralis]